MLTSLIYRLKCEEGDSLFQTLSERNGKVRAFQKRNFRGTLQSRGTETTVGFYVVRVKHEERKEF